MEKIERLYRVALKHKLNFTYRRSAAGLINVCLMSDKSDLIFDYTELESGTAWVMTNSERCDDFDNALRDFEDLLLLHGE